MLCASPDGPTISLSGQEVAPVSHSASPDAAGEQPTSGTSGPSLPGLSPSANLQSSLANRLQAVLGENGSPECALIWKTWDMGQQPPICALRASARRTSGSGSIGSQWPTPQARDYRSVTGREHLQRENHMQNLNVAATYATWPTPKASDGEGGRTTKTRGGGNSHLPIHAREAATWPTPRARDWKDGGTVPPSRQSRPEVATLGQQVAIATTWPTPLSAPTSPASHNQVSGQWRGAMEQAMPGQAPSGDVEPTEKRGALNPEFVCWLMGFPTVWVSCGASVTRSSRKSRRHL